MADRPREPSEYEAAIAEVVDRVLSRVIELSDQWERAQVCLRRVEARAGAPGAVLMARNLNRLHGPGLVSTLIDLAVEARTRNPEDSLKLAKAAVDFADELDGPMARYFRARAWAEHGNALRLQGEYFDARWSLVRAQHLAEGPGVDDPQLLGEVYSLFGSLEASLHRFDEAVAWIDKAIDCWQDAEEDCARLLVQRAHILILQSKLSQALDDLLAALESQLGRTNQDLGQLLTTCHNGLSVVLEIGLNSPKDAERVHALLLFKALLHHLGSLYEIVPAPLLRVRRSWLLGRLRLAEGRWDLARKLLDETVAAFLDLGQNAAAAVASLELALALERLQEWGELRAVAGAACAIFEAAGLEPDLWAAQRALLECDRAEVEAIILEGLKKNGGAHLRRTPGIPVP